MRKRGKILRKATYAALYGASAKMIALKTGIGMRRAKGLVKCVKS